MKKILSFSFFLTSSVILAQLPQSLMKPVGKTTKYEKYDGYVYKNINYKDANIVDEKSGTYNSKLRYNIYTDAIEFTKDSELFEIIKTHEIQVRIQGEYYYYCNFVHQHGMKQEGYYVLIELNDSYRIYKRYSLEIMEPEKANINRPTSQTSQGKIRTVTTYHLEEEGIIIELPINKRSILTLFNDKKDELKQYMSKEKIHLKKEEDLVRLVAKYNALKRIDNLSGNLLLNNNK